MPIGAVVHLANENREAAWQAFLELAELYPDNGRIQYYGGLSALNSGRPAEGNAEMAFEQLDIALEEGFGDPNLLRSEAWWNELRTDPRYEAVNARFDL